jgi:hypothetical protein
MLLDRVFRVAFRNFSTLSLIVAAVAIPLNLAYSFIWRNVIALSDLHDIISRLPAGQRVRGVSPDDVAAARGWALALVGVQILLIPVLVRAAGAARDDEASGGVPTVVGSYRNVTGRRGPNQDYAAGRGVTIVVAIVFAAGIYLLVSVAGSVVTGLLPERLSFLGGGLTRAVALALALPWPLVAVAYPGRPQVEGGGGHAPEGTGATRR